MHTWQPFDKGNGTLVYTHLWGEDSDAYWGNYDMARAVERGMKDFGLPYSGDLGFVETASYWPVTHMVAPKEQALGCGDCHTGQGRLASVEGVYRPGQDRSRWLDLIGLIVVAGTLFGVLGHGLIRMLSRRGGSHS
jgi:hypothetical protein